jgi:hypothetical protein
MIQRAIADADFCLVLEDDVTPWPHLDEARSALPVTTVLTVDPSQKTPEEYQGMWSRLWVQLQQVLQICSNT